MDEKNRPYAFWLLGAASFGVAIFGVMYGLHCHLAHWHLDKAQGLIWETILKAVAGYVAVIGAVITAFKYIDEKTRQRERDIQEDARQKELDRREDSRQREIDRKEEAKIRIQEKQAAYRRLGLSLAMIMNHDPDDPSDSELWPAAKEKFYELYWGDIPLVADDNVMELVEAFSNILHSAQTSEQKSSFAEHVSAITDACRKSLAQEWTDFHRPDASAAAATPKATAGDVPRIAPVAY